MSLKADPVVGETISPWGYTFTWTSEHPGRDKMWPMKFQIDEVGAKAYTRCVDIFNAQRSMKPDATNMHTESTGSEPQCPVGKPNIYNILVENAGTDPMLGKLYQQVNTVPEWVDWDQLARGQAVFHRYGIASLAVLAYQSLLGGFGAGGIVETLARTGGFSPDMARRRLFETAQWILEITRSIEDIKPGGDGWRSTVQVRLLHAAVRSRIMKLAEGRPEYYNTADWGVPINDVDAAGTISSFSALLIWSGLPRHGIYLRQDEIVDYIALWRYLAYVIGSPTEFFENPDKARCFQESLAYFEIEPTGTSKILAQNLVKGLVNQPPLYPSADMIVAAARRFNGDELCDELGLHQPAILFKILVVLQIWIYKGVAYTCRSSKVLDDWKVKYMRKMLWHKAVESRHAMGGKKTDFQMKYMADYGITATAGGYARGLLGGEGHRVATAMTGIFVLLVALTVAYMSHKYMHGDAVSALLQSRA